LESEKFDPDMKHYFADGLYAKQYFIPKGWAVPKHVHGYSHLSILAMGEVVVDVDGDRKFYAAPACIEISAEKIHVIVTQTDSIWYCIHATEEAEKHDDTQLVLSKEAYAGMG
jgi:hypothetical protein